MCGVLEGIAINRIFSLQKYVGYDLLKGSIVACNLPEHAAAESLLVRPLGLDANGALIVEADESFRSRIEKPWDGLSFVPVVFEACDGRGDETS